MIPSYIIIHHSLTKDGDTLDWQAIRRYHVEHNGWATVGYHYGIEVVNSEVEILVGRLMTRWGAHCLGYNQRSLGICVVGNFDEAKPSAKIWETAIELTQSLMDCLRIPPDHVLGHREAAKDSRSCPGKLWDMDEFRRRLYDQTL